MQGESQDKIRHIFGGMPESKFNPENDPQKNLELLRNDLARLGIQIDATARIANSTLKKLLDFVNSTLIPSTGELEKSLKEFFPQGRGLHLDTEAQRILGDTLASQEEKNFNIQIHPGVVIEENVDIYPSVSIGKNSSIGGKAQILTGVKIGENCQIGRAVFLGNDSLIQDNVIVEPMSTIPSKTTILRNTRAKIDLESGQMAYITELKEK